MNKWIINTSNVFDRELIENADQQIKGFAYTNIEYAMIKKNANKSGRFIIQTHMPDCLIKYQKYDSATNSIIEMSEVEKANVDLREIYVNKVSEFKGKLYKISVLSLSESDTGFIYSITNYPELRDWCLAKQSIITDIDDFGNSLIFVDDLLQSHKDLVNNDARISIDWTEKYNPDSVNFGLNPDWVL